VALRPRVVAVIAAGRLVHLTETDRVTRSAASLSKVAAA
jgi:alpha-D-ribose 1-methylphosphonate 5-triphosphate diphosphatase